MKIKVATITGLIVIFTFCSAGLYKAWSETEKIKKNTYHRLKSDFNDTWERLETLKERCGKDLEGCGRVDKALYKAWTIDFKTLGKQLGIEVEEEPE